MDVDTDISKYFEFIEFQKQNLQNARKRYGEHPRDREPREHAYLRFMMARMSITEKRSKAHSVHSTFIPPAYLPCTTPLADLQATAIRDLKLEVHHRGKYLLVRVITPPNRMTAVTVLVEDEHDDVSMLQLYQQEQEEVREATDIVDVGTLLLVKEPYFKVLASGNNHYGLRVDHLSDIVHVNEGDFMVPKSWRLRLVEIGDSAESIKMKGNLAMGKSKYWQAIKEYTNALLQPTTKGQVEVIKRNRALAFLKTQQFDAALLDTGFPNFDPDPSEKALFRAAEALYFLGRFEEARGVLENLCQSFPDNQHAASILDRAQKRCSEQNTGDYNFKVLQAEAQKLRPPQLDHATYVGPVEVRKVKDKGRGLFVTKAVQAGDLLLCEKAFSYVYVDEEDTSKSSTTIMMNLETDRGFMGGQADLIRLIVQKLHRNPSIASTFTDLHHGSYKPATVCTVDGQPIVDTFLVERIMSFNEFGCPLSSLITHKNLIRNVVVGKATNKSTAYQSCSIWTQASYMNHCCSPTAKRSFIGDMMIVRATRDMEPGTEITIEYINRDGIGGKAMQDILKNWEFTCACAMCQDEKQTKASVLAERQKLIDKLKRVCDVGSRSTDGIQTKSAERLLKALNDTYTKPATEVPRLLLWDPQLFLARVYSAKKNMVKVLKSVNEFLALLGYVIIGLDSTSVSFKIIKWGVVSDYLVEAFLHAQTALEETQAWEDAKQAEAYAKTAYKIVVGEDSSFEAVHGR